ncbi:hypothetical protein [Agrococcus versicolor]
MRDPIVRAELIQSIIGWAASVPDAKFVTSDANLVEESVPHLVAAAMTASSGATPESERVVLRHALAEHNYLPHPSAQDFCRPRALVLANHLLPFQRSPDLHIKGQGGVEIEESARTLFHDLWSPLERTSSLRAPMGHIGEVLTREGERDVVRRDRWQEWHPATLQGQKFMPLAHRLIRVRERAQDILARKLRGADSVVDALGAVVFELVQNTEWHASTPPLAPPTNCRIVEASETRRSWPSEDTSHFDRYVRSVLTLREAERGGQRPVAVTLAVISIIDSGPGLARSAAHAIGKASEFSPANEMQFLIKALSKSVATTRSGPTGNIGLPQVQQLLTNLNGFMIIRTGTTEMMRNFVTRPYEPIPKTAGAPAPSQFIDWVPEDGFNIAPRVGTAISISLPVDYHYEGE